MKDIPIGIEDFKELIETNQYYVDKTFLIKDILKEKVVLYTRPRRFGKTLNMSMLYYFFCNKENSKDLFEGLAVSKDKDTMKQLNQYPVISLSLKDMKCLDMKSSINKFSNRIVQLIDDYREIFNSSKISEQNKTILNSIYNQTCNQSVLEDSISLLSKCLKQYYDKKVIILIDEYDVPLQSAYEYGYYDEMVSFIRNVFSSALKTNSFLEKGVLTGCLRIARESIFTGLNNLRVCSILDNGTSQYFGFNQQEIDQLLTDYSMIERREEVKEWYDGYLFGNNEIYNPWSTLNYVKDVLNNNIVPVSYWLNSSGNDIVKDYIEKGNSKLREEFEILSKGGTIEKTIKPELTYREMDDINNIYSFLLFTGYLKVKEVIDEDRVVLLIPNKEVKKIYEKFFIEWFNKQIEQNSIPFVEALLNEDEKKATSIMNLILKKSISYYDNYESFYHGFLMGFLNRKDYSIQSNREQGDGRSDIVLYPDDAVSRAIVIEVKRASSIKVLKEKAHEAAMQILDKKYMEGVKLEGPDDVIGYGISFYEKSCWIEKCK